MMPKYKWQDGEQSPSKRWRNLNEQRDRMIEESNAQCTWNLEETVAEWNTLLDERDKALKKVIQKENEAILTRHLEELLDLLQVIGKLDHTNSPNQLKVALCLVHQEVRSYLVARTSGIDHNTPSSRSIPLSRSHVVDTHCNSRHTPASVENRHVKSGTQVSGCGSQGTKARRRKPFTPRESPLVFEENSSLLGNNNHQTYSMKTPSTRKSPLGVNFEHSAPYQRRKSLTPQVRKCPVRTTDSGTGLSGHRSSIESENLRCNLLKGKDNLRSTPGITRSPGGTPQKNARVFNLSDAGDLVACALKKKFMNIRKLYGSPQSALDNSRDDEADLSIDTTP